MMMQPAGPSRACRWTCRLRRAELDDHADADDDDAQDAEDQADTGGPVQDSEQALGLCRDDGGGVGDDACCKCGEGVHGETFQWVVLGVVSVARAAKSVMKRWYSRAGGGVVESPCRQASTQGRVQSRGAPPPTMAAKSRKGFGSLPRCVRQDGEAEQIKLRAPRLMPTGSGRSGRLSGPACLHGRPAAPAVCCRPGGRASSDR